MKVLKDTKSKLVQKLILRESEREREGGGGVLVHLTECNISFIMF